MLLRPKKTQPSFNQCHIVTQSQRFQVEPGVHKTWIEEDNQLTPDSITLRGRMEVRSGVWAHQIAPKSFAVRTCDSCHLPGHRERMGFTVSVASQDGRVQQFDAGADAMSSAAAVDSIGDFSLFGISVNKMLDIMFLLSLGAGIAVPVGHFTLGTMIKEKLDRGGL